MVNVLIECTAVPDGIVEVEGQPRLRLSLVLRPVPDPDGEGFDFLNWPEVVNRMSFVVSVGAPGEDLVDVATGRRAPPSTATGRLPPDAGDLWRRIWEPSSDAIADYLDPPQSSIAEVQSYSTSALIDLIERRAARKTASGIAAARRWIRTSSGPSDETDARLLNPDHRANALADHVHLMSRDGFGTIVVGDALGGAIAALDAAPVDKQEPAVDALERGPTFGGRHIPAFIETELERHGHRGAMAALGPSRVDNLDRPLDDDAFGTKLSVKTAPSETRLMLEAVDRAFAEDSPRPCPDRGQTPEEAESAARAAKAAQAAQYSASLQAHPSLRQHLGLIVDLLLDKDSVSAVANAAGRGVVSVRASEHTTPTPARVAFQLDGALFEPCPRQVFGFGADPAPLPLTRGVVDLNAKVGDTPRFRLEALDATAAMLATRTQAQTVEGALRAGAAPCEIPIDEPNLRTRGLCVLDTQALEAAEADQKRAMALADPTLLFAEDLVDGYRLDLVDGNGARFPAGRRQVTFSPTGSDAFTLPDPVGREEGFVTPIARIRTERNGDDETEIAVVSETLLTWTGDNIGLSSPEHGDMAGDSESTGSQPKPLPVAASYDFLPDDLGGMLPENLGPILRYGKGYRVVLRARKINGSSVQHIDAETLRKCALGGEPGKSWIFLPCERSPAPDVLVPVDDAPAITKGASTVHRVIVSEDDALPSTSHRVLTSGRVGREAAEHWGLFDGARGEFRRKSGFYREVDLEASGTYRAVESKLLPDDRYETRVGDLFRLQAPYENRRNPFWVDPSLRTMGARLEPAGCTGHKDMGWTIPRRDLNCWRGGPEGEPQPVLLQVRAVGGAVNGMDASPVKYEERSGRSMMMDGLSVTVAPGHSLELSVWTNRSLDIVGRTRIVNQASRLAVSAGMLPDADRQALIGGQGGPVSDRGAQLWAELTRGNRFAALTNVTRFRIEHHVRRPLSAPRFKSFGCVRVPDTEAWEDQASQGPPYEDMADGQRVIAFGDIEFDRRSTGSVWAECAWLETDPAIARRRSAEVENDHALDQTGLWAYAPVEQTERLFEINDVPLSALPDLATSLNLVRSEDGSLRTLTGPFHDGRARRLVVRLWAKTRFTDSFEGSERELSRSSADDAAFQRAIGGGTVSATDGGIRVLWLKATKRPSKPTLSSDNPVAYRRRFDTIRLPDRRSARRLAHSYILWLDENWEQGEKLAIICRDAVNGPADAGIAALDPHLSRWGADMTMAPGAPIARDSYLQPEHIVGAEDLTLSLPTPEGLATASDSSRSVRLAILTPQFDTGLGRWFCEIATSAIPAFKAHLKLGLARYQPNAIRGCELSETVMTDAFALHQPWTFAARRGGDTVTVVAIGPAYAQRAPMATGLFGVEDQIDRIADLARHPLVSAELERLVGGGVIPSSGADGRPLIVTSANVEPVAVDREGRPDPTEPGWLSWTLEIPIPRDLRRRELSVRVSLSSFHANAEAAIGAVAEGGLIHLPEPLAIQFRLPPP